MPTLTIQVADLLLQGPILRVEVGVDNATEAAHLAAGRIPPSRIPALSLIDTGAAISMVRSGLLAPLGLTPTGAVPLQSPGIAGIACPTYPVRLFFPNRVSVELAVAEVSLAGQSYDCLIGRDVLKLAALVYLGEANIFSLSF